MAVMIDGPMITKFIENSETFEKFATAKFELINENREKKSAESMALDREESHEESHDDEFEAVDLESYKAELKEMMKAVAQGIGNTPVSVLVEEGSVFLKVYEVEIVRIKKEKEEEKMKNMKKIEEDRESNKNLKKGEVMASPKKIKKKNSFDFLNFCACSGKQFVEHN